MHMYRIKVPINIVAIIENRVWKYESFGKCPITGKSINISDEIIDIINIEYGK